MIDIRASSLREFFDCACRWEAKHIKKLRLPRTAAAQLGTAIHAGTAAYDGSKVAGNIITVDDAIGPLVDAIHHPGEEVVWDEIKPTEAEKIGIALHTKYCTEVSPLQDYVGVEVTCDRLEITDLGIALTGTTDRVRREGTALGVCDIKTGKTAVGTNGKPRLQGHALQIAVYELLAGAVIGEALTAPAQIIGMHTGKTAQAQRVGVGEIVSARSVLLGDEDHPGMLEHAAKMLKEGFFPGNPGSMMCSEKYCPIYNSCRYKA
jgi:hypothetical protein